MLENEVYQWLSGYGIPVPEHRYFSMEGNLAADHYPVALKIVSPKVVHKTEAGGVQLDLKNQTELEQARKEILASLQRHGIIPEQNDGWIVTRMYSGIELFFGIIRDPVFGKVILFGAGGVAVELFRDICYIDSEADEAEIRRAIAGTKIGTIFTKGFRGKQYAIGPVVELIRKLQQLEVQELDCNPVILTQDQLVVVDARSLPDTAPAASRAIKDVSGLFRPGKTAIIGVSANPEKVGYGLAENTADDPDCYYVNPHLESLFGKKVYSRIEDLPETDTAVLCVPAAAVQESIEKLVQHKVQQVVVITAGFREAGCDEQFLTDLARQYGIHIVGPNCLGIYANGRNLTFGPGKVRSGTVHFFSQSGAIAADLMDKASSRNTGFASIISVGNMADVDFADLISSCHTGEAINLYIEGVSNGKNLLRAVRASHLPVRIFKAGRSEAAKKAAFSHTGNLSGNYELFTGLLQHAGAKMLRDINGLLYPYDFKNILIITNAGGAGTVMADAIGDKLKPLTDLQITALNTVLPAHWSKNNPVDIIGDATHDRYQKALETADAFGYDAIFVLVSPQFMTDTEKIVQLFCGVSWQTPVFPVLLGGDSMEHARAELRHAGLVWFDEISEAVSFL